MCHSHTTQTHTHIHTHTHTHTHKQDADDAQSADSYPNTEATEKAKAFNAETDYSTGVAPTYNKGDAVWIYRKRLKKWVAAEVTDNRQVMIDSI